jgi:hypothetical protein
MKIEGMQKMTYYSDLTIDDVEIGEQVLTTWTNIFDVSSSEDLDNLPRNQALVVDKGTDASYAGNGWVRLAIDGKNTQKISVQWVIKE